LAASSLNVHDGDGSASKTNLTRNAGQVDTEEGSDSLDGGVGLGITSGLAAEGGS